MLIEAHSIFPPSLRPIQESAKPAMSEAVRIPNQACILQAAAIMISDDSLLLFPWNQAIPRYYATSPHFLVYC